MVMRMGNIVSIYIKHIAKEFINIYPNKIIASDFLYNKEKIFEIVDFDGKVI